MATSRDLSVLCCTANVGNTHFDDLSAWIPADGCRPDGGHYDIVAVGIQEGVFGVPQATEEETAMARELAAADEEDEAFTGSKGGWTGLLLDKLNSKCSKHIDAVLRTTLGGDYCEVGGGVRGMQMRLKVFARRGGKIDGVESAGRNTGLGAGALKLANKGGQAVSFRANGVSLVFLNAHLAAHAGEKHRLERDDNVHDILSGCRLGHRRLDAASQFDHAFFMGDLNYRLDLARLDAELATAKPEDACAEVVRRIEAAEAAAAGGASAHEAWGGLWGADELMAGAAGLDDPSRPDVQLQEPIFSGWRTRKPAFRPTYKVLRGEAYKHVPKRVPAWCDRVLWKSLPGLAAGLRVLEHANCPAFLTSDHKPVRCGFAIPQTPAPPMQGKAMARLPEERCIAVRVTRLAAEGIKNTARLDTPDPYVKVYGVPDGLFGPLHRLNSGCCLRGGTKAPRGFHRTTIKQNDLTPAWADETIALRLNLPAPALRKDECVSPCHIILACMDNDRLSWDDALGSIAIPLADILSADGGRLEFTQPLIQGGRRFGTIRGCIEVSGV